MRLLHTALVFLILTPAIAQDPASAQQKAARETRERMQLISTRAFGNFRAAESVEYRLQQEGMTLHPQLIALRARVESALYDARDDLQAGRIKEANETLDRAQAWLDRFAHRMGGGY